jgi:tetratricopeptide (TPR) repeat protein
MSPHSGVRVITIVLVLALFSSLGFAQATGKAPSKPTTGAPPPAGTGSNNTGFPSSTTTNSTNNKTGPTYTPPIYLTGRVMLEDGTPPSEPATIERVCNGNARAEGYTDSQGNFGIELGRESTVFQDASEDSSRSTFPGIGSGSGSGAGPGTSPGLGSNAAITGGLNRYQNCELRAKLPGYRSQTLSLANRRSLDDPNVGIILLHKEGASETGTTISAKSLAAPKESRKAYERGMQAAKKNKLDDASKDFEKAVELYPEHAEAWYELGRLQVEREDVAGARQSFGAALKSDPKFMGPYLQLSMLSMKERNWPELAELTDRAMRLDSFDYPQVFLFNAVANYNLHKFEIADRSIKQAQRLDTQHRFPEIMRLSGLILVLHKDYAAAAEQFRSFLKVSSSPEDMAAVRTQLTEIERITAQGSVAQKEK